MNNLKELSAKVYQEPKNLKTKWPYALLFLLSTALLWWVVWDTFKPVDKHCIESKETNTITCDI